MRARQILSFSFVLLFAGTAAQAQAPAATPEQSREQGASPAGQKQERTGRGEERGQPLFGKITAISGESLELSKPNGTSASLKITGKTEFRKDRQPAKLADFRVGDMVFVRAEEDAAHSLTAVLIGGRSGGGGGPQGGGRGFGGGMFGEMGKDFVAGEVKSVDAPRITVLRPDGVTQTLELSEETSLRRGRESITMADIQPGDHLMARGAVQNNVSAPKNVAVFSAEEWRRMQEMRRGKDFSGKEPSAPAKSDPPKQ
ncbi:MAG: DUF5666 domain-containing protein [Acidobacteriia bacterium]|nr:DUF5666 domain-containing protein [Terriglobia bacterium]